MKKTKKITMLLFICFLMFSLCACNKDGGETSTSTGAAEGDSKKGVITGEIIDSGFFKALCPEGWLNIPQTDVFAEKDENGNYPPNKRLLVFRTGAATVEEAESMPGVGITLTDEGKTVEDQLTLLGYFTQEYEETTYTIGGVECRGAKYSWKGSVKDTFYHYEIAYIEKFGRLFQVNVITGTPEIEDSGLNFSAPVVLGIIESLELD